MPARPQFFPRDNHGVHLDCGKRVKVISMLPLFFFEFGKSYSWQGPNTRPNAEFDLLDLEPQVVEDPLIKYTTRKKAQDFVFHATIEDAEDTFGVDIIPARCTLPLLILAGWTCHF